MQDDIWGELVMLAHARSTLQNRLVGLEDRVEAQGNSPEEHFVCNNLGASQGGTALTDPQGLDQRL